MRYRHYSSYERERRSYRDVRDFSDKRRRGDLGRSHDNDPPVFRRKRSRSPSPRTKKSHRDDLGSPRHRLESHTERTRKSSRPDSRSPRREATKSSSGDEGSKSKHRKRSLSRSGEVVHHSSDKRDNRREDKSKSRSRRRSRSDSPVGRNHAQRSSPRVLEESRSRHRKRSRSRSVEDKHQSGEKRERNVEDKSRDQDKRRSRSKSAEGRHRKGSKSSSLRSDGHKSKHRKHSRLNDIVTVDSKDKTLKVENEKSVASDDMDVDRLTELGHTKDNEVGSDKSFSE